MRISSEEAGALSMTPVLARDMPLRELVELMLDLTGKDPVRVRELLLRGTFVVGASRYRWPGWEADLERLGELLASLPSPEPERAFLPALCSRVVVHGPGLRFEFPQAALSERRLLRKRSFWDALMDVIEESGLTYAGYSYREHADRYRLEVSGQTAARVAAMASLLRYSRLEEHLRGGAVSVIEFLVRRIPS